MYRWVFQNKLQGWEEGNEENLKENDDSLDGAILASLLFDGLMKSFETSSASTGHKSRGFLDFQ